MTENTSTKNFQLLLKQKAYAAIKGGPLAPEIEGTIYFIDVPGGTDIVVKVNGLPPYQSANSDNSPIGPHGFHIHEHANCETGDPENPFLAAGRHWNPDNQPHGNHAGDLPVLFSNNGRARMRVYTDRFKPAEVVGKTIIIHENPDDYRTQPTGNAGKRLACGSIKQI